MTGGESAIAIDVDGEEREGPRRWDVVILWKK
jgi:hypothetical protein